MQSPDACTGTRRDGVQPLRLMAPHTPLVRAGFSRVYSRRRALAVPGQRRVYRSPQRDISRDMKMGGSKTGCGQKVAGRRPPFESLTCSEGVFCVSAPRIGAENQNQYKGVRRQGFFQKSYFRCVSCENVAHHVRQTKLAANSVPLEDRRKNIAAII